MLRFHEDNHLPTRAPALSFGAVRLFSPLRRMLHLRRCSFLVALAALSLVKSQQQQQFLHHNLTLDAGGDILPWLPLPLGSAFSQFAVRAAYWFAHDVPIDPATGLPIFYTHGQIPFVHWPHTPSRFTSWSTAGGAALLAFNGDDALLRAIAVPHSRYMAGANGSAPVGWAWAGAAFASSEPGQLLYRGANSSNFANCGARCCTPGNACPGDGVNNLEPDKAANVGLAYARLFMLYGDEAQLANAVATADALVANEVAPANSTHSPWPFRVAAQSGASIEAYSSSVTDALRLFDALAVIARVSGAAKVPNLTRYLETRGRVLSWLMTVPVTSNAWQGIWEDVPDWATPTDDPSCHTALDAASYLMDAADLAGGPDANTLSAVRKIVDWVVDVFVFEFASSREPAVQWGAYAVSEQACDRNKMAYHTLHFTSVAARLANATANATLRGIAERSVSWSTYVLQDDNQTLIGPVDQSNWLGVGLQLPEYMIASLAPVSAWAAPSEDHIVRSSGLVTSVAFSAAAIAYTTFDPRSLEQLQLGACRRSGVAAGGVPLPRGGGGGGNGGGDNTAGYWTVDESGVGVSIFKSNANDVVVSCAPPS